MVSKIDKPVCAVRYIYDLGRMRNVEQREPGFHMKMLWKTHVKRVSFCELFLFFFVNFNIILMNNTMKFTTILSDLHSFSWNFVGFH